MHLVHWREVAGIRFAHFENFPTWVSISQRIIDKVHISLQTKKKQGSSLLCEKNKQNITVPAASASRRGSRVGGYSKFIE